MVNAYEVAKGSLGSSANITTKINFLEKQRALTLMSHLEVNGALEQLQNF